MTENIPILILAAGKGERFKAAGGMGNKLLATYPNIVGEQRPLIELTLQNALATGYPVQLVTRPEYGDISRLAIRAGVPVTLVDSNGMGESIAAGVRASVDSAGWLILPGDMGWIPPDIIRSVAQAINQPTAQARTIHNGVPGHPVGFGRAYRQDLAQLHDDKGAKSVIDPEVLTLIESQHAVIQDADLPLA